MNDLTHRPAVRRTLWVVFDQGLSSLTNFVVTIAVARTVDAQAFGAFSIAYLLYLLSTVLVRGLVAGPLTVRASREPSNAAPAAAAAGASLACGAVLGAVAALGGLVIGGTTGTTLMILGVFLGPLLLQDVWRFAFVALARPAAAVANEVVWISGQFVLVGLALGLATPSPAILTAAWAGGATLAALAGTIQIRRMPVAPRQAWAFVRLHSDLGVPFAGTAFAQFASAQLAMLVVGLVVGVTGVGALRAAQTLVGPVLVLIVGFSSAVVAEASRLAATDRRRVPRSLATMSSCLGLIALCWGALLLLLGPQFGDSLLGQSWTSARAVLPATIAATVAIGLSSGAQVGLQVLEAGRALFAFRLALGAASVGVALIGAIAAGVQGGAWALALAALLGGAGAWQVFRRTFSETGTARPG